MSHALLGILRWIVLSLFFGGILCVFIGFRVSKFQKITIGTKPSLKEGPLIALLGMFMVMAGIALAFLWERLRR
jgi:hypothetical protein